MIVVLFLNYQLYYISEIYSPTLEGQPSLYNDWLFIHGNVIGKRIVMIRELSAIENRPKKSSNVVKIKPMICPIFVDVILCSLTRNIYFETCSFKADMF